jgi:outer membrane protein assembly factor BamD (BamD/ComL family)
MAAVLLLLLGAADAWEYRPGIGFVNSSSMEKKSPEEFLAYAAARREAGDPAFAVAALTLVMTHAPDGALRERAHFERAETQLKRGNPYEAYYDYEAFILRYPQSDRATQAKRMEMTAALELARVGHRETVLGIPLFSSSRTGIEYLRDALKRYPREDFSADFYQKLGMFYYDREDWDKAIEEFQQVLDQYADAAESVLALYMLGRTSEQKFDTVDRDIRPLKDARRHFERFLEEADRLRRLPPPADFWVGKLIGAVRERLARVYDLMLEKLLLVADYYVFKGFPRSAALYYQAILREDFSFRRVLKDPKDFPETRAALKARSWLREAGLPPAPARAAAAAHGAEGPAAATREARRLARDTAGWLLVVEKGGAFVLLSAAPGAELEETAEGVRLRIGSSSFALGGNQGLLIVDRKGGVSSAAVPEGWGGDLVRDYRDYLAAQPQGTIRSWLESRLKQHPAPALEGLLRE